jgi:hypothetical protein
MIVVAMVLRKRELTGLVNNGQEEETEFLLHIMIASSRI